MAQKQTKKDVAKQKGNGSEMKNLIEGESRQERGVSTNKLYEGDYKEPGELMFLFKKMLKKPLDLPAKGVQKQDQNIPKISEIAWGNQRYPAQLVSIDDTGKLMHWDAATGKMLTLIEASKTWLNSVDFERTEGKKVACGSLDAKLLIFEINIPVKKKEKDINKNKPIHELVGHTGAVQCCKFLNGNFLISGSTDSTVCVWDLESPQRFFAKFESSL